jgi:carbamoyltransferase
MADHVHNETKLQNLCLAGGVALNCVANGRILREGPFENIWIQPSAGDAGGAMGASLCV